MAPRPASPTTARSVAFVAARRDDAERLGREVGEEIQDPETAVAVLRDGMERLADPDHLAGQRLVAPGIGPLLGVRSPLHAAVSRGFRQETRHDRSSALLSLAERLFREDLLELRWFGFTLLERTVAEDPALSWQLLRRAAREAGDWITVDALARPYGRGILLAAFRWAELEQLIYSSSRWERRLVGSTIAMMPHVDRSHGRSPDVVARALPLLGELIGDDEPDVQKALAWAYRTLAQLDPERTAAALMIEADRAAATDDGHRACVIREVLPKLRADEATGLRGRLSGIRRRAGVPSTSLAAATAARFLGGAGPADHDDDPQDAHAGDADR